ncbi:MAG: hypothetical protein E7626_03405 [Ruminococcaceae bacterium]|nr:hypothetical protein [Oscillospiraceae bacterium]
MDLSKIPHIVLLIVTMASCLGVGIAKNSFSKNVSSTQRGYQIFNMVSSAICALVILAYSGFKLDGSIYSLIIGALFGIVTAIAAIFNLAAVSIGPLSYTTVIISSSTVITAISGLFFGEIPSIPQWIGIAFMMVCIVLATKKKEDDRNKKTSVKWLVFSFLAAIFTAGVGLLQKVHQESDHSDELSLMLFIAFIVSTLFSFVLYLISLKKDPPIFAQKNGSKKKAAILLGALLFVVGIAIALNNIINLYLVGVMKSAVFFPIINGGHLILSTLAGLLLFKEKLTAKQWIGIIFGIAATFLLCF